MSAVMIAYRRPIGLSEDELRSWLISRAGSRMSLRLDAHDWSDGRGVVQVSFELPPQPMRAQDAIDGLLGDMRMLGLQPAVVPGP
jgi:hypothetical protein